MELSQPGSGEEGPADKREQPRGFLFFKRERYLHLDGVSYTFLKRSFALLTQAHDLLLIYYFEIQSSL